jgi:AcrR family transcriptional regulator
MSGTDYETRKRRAPGEVERLIIDAAKEVFAAKGYAGATTREIAGLANVHEPMVYRRFESKAKLFEATVLAPFNELISQYLDTYRPHPDPNASTEELARRFIEPFYDLMRERRDLVLALLAAAQFHDDFSDDGTLSLTGLRHLIELLEPQLQIESAARPLHGVDVPATMRVVMGMIMGMAIFEAWMQPEGNPVARDRLVDEMVKVSIYGITRPPGGAGGEAAAAKPSDDRDVGELLDRVADAERRAIRAELELDLISRRSAGPRIDDISPASVEDQPA